MVVGEAEVGAAALRVADVGDQHARGALGLDRPQHVGRVEERNLLDPHGRVVDPGVALDLDRGAAEAEAPVGHLIAGAGGEGAVGHGVDVLGDLGHLGALEEVVGGDVAGGLGQGASLGLEQPGQGGAGEPPRPLVDDHPPLGGEHAGRQVDLHPVGLELDVLVLRLDAARQHHVVVTDELEVAGGAGDRAAAALRRHRQLEADRVGPGAGGGGLPARLRRDRRPLLPLLPLLLCRRRRGGDQEQGEGERSQPSLSTIIAVASPPPMQIAAQPRRAPRRSIALSRVTRMRAPEAPIGWPSATAPP